MKEINERWIANGSINIDDITSKANFLGKAIDDVLEENHTEKPTTHRFHKEMARIYRKKLNDAIKEKSFVRAEIIVQTMIDSYNPEEIMFWYDNPDFKAEKECDYHHNKSGKKKIEKIRTVAEELRAILGLYEERGYARHPKVAEDIFKRIVQHICDTDIVKHAKALKKTDAGSEYQSFVRSAMDISHKVRSALIWKENRGHLMEALDAINELHKKYNERYVGEKYHDVCKETRIAAEKFLIDVGLLRTVITRYLGYKENQASLASRWMSTRQFDKLE